MALTIVKRPQGFINSPTSNTGTYSNGSSIITKVAHGLTTGTRIYITANQAIGFWYVTPLTVDTFNISEYSGASVYNFIGAGTFTYYATVNPAGHVWNAVHLPIVYKLTSNKWPINSVDTVRTVSSYANDNGYVKITASGVLEANITELEFIKVTFTGGTTGIYQVLSWYSSSIVTINLAYTGGITFVSVQFYYNNYRAKIRVYAGLQSTHFFNAQKPYTLMTEQSIIPDINGVITFNIAEFIKSQISILKNDLLKGTLQNNLDAFCQFYITYAEGYDYSTGGYTLLDFVGSYTDDSTNFQGIAVNADLPFKNIHSGFLSDYVYGSSVAKLKFLTPTLFPVLNVGYFFDISFVNQFGAELRMKRECYVNGVVRNLFFDAIDDKGIGVYRYELSQSIYLEDRIDLTLQFFDYSNWIDISEVKSITINSTNYLNAINLSWLNYLGGFDHYTFKTNSDYGVNIEGTKTVNKNIFTQWPASFGEGGDTILQETSRNSRGTITIRTEKITSDQMNDIFRIKTSPMVQIINSRTDRKTLIIDTNSFIYLQQSKKLFDLEFNVILTDNLSSQQL